MSMIDKLSPALRTKANKSIKIQSFEDVDNDIGEKIKTWSDKYTFSAIFYAKRNSGKGEHGEKVTVEGRYKTRFNLSDIEDDIANISEDYRVEVDGLLYKIEFIDVPFSDHVVLELSIIK